MINADMPSRLTQAEELLFLSFRCLYYAYHNGIVDKKKAQSEKKKLINSFELNQNLIKMYQTSCDISIKLAGMSKEIEAGDCDMCKKLMWIFDGKSRKPTFNEECSHESI